VSETQIITVAEMDRMTPGERAAAVRKGTILNRDELPEDFRRRIEERAIRGEAFVLSRRDDFAGHTVFRVLFRSTRTICLETQEVGWSPSTTDFLLYDSPPSVIFGGRTIGDAARMPT
jgi:hypothetical protein